jgi:hypothetical protein
VSEVSEVSKVSGESFKKRVASCELRGNELVRGERGSAVIGHYKGGRCRLQVQVIF